MTLISLEIDANTDRPADVAIAIVDLLSLLDAVARQHDYITVRVDGAERDLNYSSEHGWYFADDAPAEETA